MTEPNFSFFHKQTPTWVRPARYRRLPDQLPEELKLAVLNPKLAAFVGKTQGTSKHSVVSASVKTPGSIASTLNVTVTDEETQDTRIKIQGTDIASKAARLESLKKKGRGRIPAELLAEVNNDDLENKYSTLQKLTHKMMWQEKVKNTGKMPVKKGSRLAAAAQMVEGKIQYDLHDQIQAKKKTTTKAGRQNRFSVGGRSGAGTSGEEAFFFFESLSNKIEEVRGKTVKLPKPLEDKLHLNYKNLTNVNQLEEVDWQLPDKKGAYYKMKHREAIREEEERLLALEKAKGSHDNVSQGKRAKGVKLKGGQPETKDGQSKPPETKDGQSKPLAPRETLANTKTVLQKDGTVQVKTSAMPREELEASIPSAETKTEEVVMSTDLPRRVSHHHTVQGQG